MPVPRYRESRFGTIPNPGSRFEIPGATPRSRDPYPRSGVRGALAPERRWGMPGARLVDRVTGSEDSVAMIPIAG